MPEAEDGADQVPVPKKILIVEDVGSDAELIERELRRGGLELTTRHASTRDEFLRAIDAELPDVVLSDFRMPGFDGMSVVREVQARSPLTPVIIVTGSLTEEIAAECIKRGAADYVLKENLSRLVPAVRAAVEMRRLREEELRSHQEIIRARDYYLTLLEDLPIPVWRARPDAKVDYFNKAWLAWTGRTLEAELGDHWTENIHPDDLASVYATYQPAFEKRAPYYVEFRLRHADGLYRWLGSHARPMFGLGGEFAGYVGSCYDLQAVRDTEAKLQAEWNFLETILDKLDQLIYVFDARDIVTFVNGTAYSARRMTPGEIIGRSIYDFPWLTPECIAAYEQAKLTKQAVQFGELAVPTREGEQRLYDGWMIPLVNPDGTDGVISSFSDVTVRAAAEATQKLLTTAIEHAVEAVVITDPNGVIEYVNPAFETSTGYSALEAIGRNSRFLKSGVGDSAFYKDLWDTITAGEVWRGRFVNRRKDGSTFHEEASISPVRDTQERIAHFVAVKRDLSREVELEHQLAQSQKLDAIGRLAGGIAHDFNNLLGVITGYTEMLTHSLGSDHAAQERLLHIRTASDRAAALTRQLLAFGRRQVLQPTVIDLNALIAESHELLRRLLREDIEIIVTASLEPAAVRVDRSQFEQVLFNLVVNARDAMPQGGTLRIATSLVTVDEDSSSIRDAIEPGRWVRLDVRDTGAGMTREQMLHIFEPFFTTKRENEGAGLGLATAYGIVKQSGGNVVVRSEPQQGTLFRIYLPAAELVAAEAAPARGRAVSLRAKHEARTILLVEDQEMLREMIREGLEEAGMQVLEARDGEEALTLARGFAAQIDLLLTDVVMPKISGRELAETIIGERPELKMLFMSGYTSDIIAKAGELEEGFTLLQKPFTIDELLARIEKVMNASA
jgi:PAS domain S-box-containing protein